MNLLPTPRLLTLALVPAAFLAFISPDEGPGLLAILWWAGLAVAVRQDVIASPGVGAFLVSRRHQRRLWLGEPNPIEVSVEWQGPQLPVQAVRLSVRDEAPPGIPHEELVLVGSILRGGRWEGTYQLTPKRRGQYSFGAINLRVETRFHLVVRQLRYPTTDEVRVYPSVAAISRYELIARHGPSPENGLRRSYLRGLGGEFERLREYVPGDDFRRIAWKATARRHQPVTREDSYERSQNVIMMIDTGRLMATPVGAMEKLDYAVNAALMMAHVANRKDDRFGLLVFADTVQSYLPPGRGRRQFELVMDQLYRIASQPVEANLGRALAHLSLRQSRRSLVVLMTDVAEAADADTLVAYLGALGRKHLPLYVTIRDPDLSALAAVIPEDSRQAYEKVVAHELLDERRYLLERIAARGALVLDTDAGSLTASTIERYLDIKERSQL